MTDARWLSPTDAATYVGKRVDELPRLVKRGLLPVPSFHFGPKSPRYDRQQLDALFVETPVTVSVKEAEKIAIHEIETRSRQKRNKEISRRNSQGLSLRSSS